jgi:hypothetical protein
MHVFEIDILCYMSLRYESDVALSYACLMYESLRCMFL